MRLRLYISPILILVTHLLVAQTSVSFYQLGPATFQNSNYNPTFLPDGKIFFGLPVLSGVHLNYNSRLSYSEVIKTNPESGNPKIYPEMGLKEMGKNNLIRAHATISLIHFGIRADNGMTLSVFANERIQSDVFFTKQTIRFFSKGNKSVIDQRVELGKNRSNISHFREIGVGVSYPSPSLPMIIGARVKYLQGFLNISTPSNQSVYLTSDAEDYVLSGNLKGGMLRTSGMDLVGNGSHYGFNGNSGLALDLGFQWELDKYNSFSASLVDIGYISWKENIDNTALRDTTFTYSGIDLDDLSGIRKVVEDSLLGNFKKDKNTKPYSTMLGTKLYATWVFHTPYPGGDVVGSIGTRYLQGKFNMMVGAGYRQQFGNWFTGTVNVTKLPQQFFNLGTSFAIKGGPVQFYMAVDQIYNFDLTKFQAFDARVGINFIIGNGKPKGKGLSSNSSVTTFDKNQNDTKQNSNAPGSQSFMGSKVKVKKQEGIYSIIPKQEPRRKEEYYPNSDPNGEN